VPEADVATASDVLAPAGGSQESEPMATEINQLRTTIVNDESRHGVWLQLPQYGPLPKRIALTIASSWRRAKPDIFGGGRHFSARIVPVVSDNSSRHFMTVRSEKLYAVEVAYPHPTDENK
jgi:hypothetical protein